MDFSIRTATPAEQMYSYSQSSQIEGQTGCIGHLRADFGSDGNSFYSSWADHNASLKDQAFKDEFDHLINTLRGLEASCASLLFAQGVSLKEIQAWLGHSTIGTTANIYTHLDENNKLSSANAIIAILPEM